MSAMIFWCFSVAIFSCAWYITNHRPAIRFSSNSYIHRLSQLPVWLVTWIMHQPQNVQQKWQPATIVNSHQSHTQH